MTMVLNEGTTSPTQATVASSVPRTIAQKLSKNCHYHRLTKPATVEHHPMQATTHLESDTELKFEGALVTASSVLLSPA